MEETPKIWMLESVRLSFFTKSITNHGDMEKWIKAITGSEANQIQKGHAGFEGIGLCQGDFFVLKGGPNRIDILFQPQPNNLAGNIGDLSKIFQITQLVCDSLDNLDGWIRASRIAVSATITRIAENQIDANLALSELLPNVVIDANKTTDFLYRVNRPSNIDCGTILNINCLGTWQTAIIQHVQFQFEVTSNLPHGINRTINAPVQLLGDPILIAKAELECNTDAGIDVDADNSKQKTIIMVLATEVSKLASSGDLAIRVDAHLE